MNADREQPKELGAERALLGGLIREAAWLADIREQLDPEDFYTPHHASLYRLLLTMASAGEPIDLTTLGSKLRTGDAAFGGVTYVVSLPEDCPSTVNLRHYAELVRKAAEYRRLIAFATRLLDEAFEQSSPPGVLADEAVSHLCELGAGPTRYPIVKLARAIEEADRQRDMVIEGAAPGPLSSGFRQAGTPEGYSLDWVLGGGFRPGQLVVVGGGTSMGKTGFAVALSAEAALRGRSVLYVSMEMPSTELANRFRAYSTRLPLRTFDRRPSRQEQDIIEDCMPNPERLGVYLYFRPAATLDQVRVAARRSWSRGELSMLCVDYLQRMDVRTDRGQTRADAIGQTTSALKTLALELNIPIVVLSQLNREFDRRNEPAVRRAPTPTGNNWWSNVALPTLSDLAESGKIEHDADVVLFPCNADRMGVPHTCAPGRTGLVVVAKQRNGPRAVVQCGWSSTEGVYRP